MPTCIQSSLTGVNGWEVKRTNFYQRERGAVTEFSAWSPTHHDPADFHVPACFGELVFIDDQEEV